MLYIYIYIYISFTICCVVSHSHLFHAGIQSNPGLLRQAGEIVGGPRSAGRNG